MKLSDKVDRLLAEAEELAQSRGTALRLEAERQVRLDRVVDRFEQLVDEAAKLMNDGERERLDSAIEQANHLAGPLCRWLDDLADGRSRLPELTAATMRELLLAWLDSRLDKYCPAIVCVHCGLEYPEYLLQSLSELELLPGRQWGDGPPPWHVIPERFRPCLHCGQSNYQHGMDWPHLVAGKAYPWMQLEGYVGQPIRDSPEQSEL